MKLRILESEWEPFVAALCERADVETAGVILAERLADDTLFARHLQLVPAEWDTAWRALRDAAGLPGLRFHDLRHTVVTRLLEAGEPDHVVESITGHLSRRMLEHYSHIRLSAKKAALDRLDATTKGSPIKSAK
jgi:integrase